MMITVGVTSWLRGNATYKTHTKLYWQSPLCCFNLSHHQGKVPITRVINIQPPTTDRVLVIGPPFGLNVPPSWFNRAAPSWLADMPGSSMPCSWKGWCGAELEGGSRVWYGPEGESWGRWGGSMWSGRVGGVIGGMLKSSSPKPPTGND